MNKKMSGGGEIGRRRDGQSARSCRHGVASTPSARGWKRPGGREALYVNRLTCLGTIPYKGNAPSGFKSWLPLQMAPKKQRKGGENPLACRIPRAGCGAAPLRLYEEGLTIMQKYATLQSPLEQGQDSITPERGVKGVWPLYGAPVAIGGRPVSGGPSAVLHYSGAGDGSQEGVMW